MTDTRRRSTDFASLDLSSAFLYETERAGLGAIGQTSPSRAQRLSYTELLRLNFEWAEKFSDLKELYEHQGRTLSSTQQELMQERASRKAFQKMALFDNLTGLPNRAAFEIELDKALDSDQHVTIAFIDLNKFKAINDTYGHEAGDIALKTVADYLKDFRFRQGDGVMSLREALDIDLTIGASDDFATRLGGDEFVVIFRDTDAENLKDRAKELEAGLNQLEFAYHGNIINVRGSVGVFDCQEGMDARSCLKAADAKMYKRKQENEQREDKSDSRFDHIVKQLLWASNPTAP